MIKDDLNKGKSQLAELELEAITADYTRKRAQLERQLKIRQLKTKLDLDRDKLTRTSRIVSQVHGRVAQVLSCPGRAGPRGVAGRPASLRPGQSGAPMRTGSAVRIDHLRARRRGEEDRDRGRRRGEPGDGQARRARIYQGKGRGRSRSCRPPELAMEAALEHPELVEPFSSGTRRACCCASTSSSRTE